ncbi:DNA-binding protein [Clostridia bacterium]|nr:DNA-binding protein [Clostridia bacterium]
MKKETTVTAKSLETALETASAEFGVSADKIEYEVVEQAKKGFLGIGSAEAKYRFWYEEKTHASAAEDFLKKIIAHMEINAHPIVVEENDEEVKFEIKGENLGSLIGYHGEILDSLQYLTYLAVNQAMKGQSDSASADDGEGSGHSSVRITIDIEDYRRKREETLITLAHRMSERVLKYGKQVSLDPMNAYERRIIHSTVQDIPGVTTYSVGLDNDRRIIITKEGYQTVSSRGEINAVNPSRK